MSGGGDAVETAVDRVAQQPKPLQVFPVSCPLPIGSVHASSLAALIGDGGLRGRSGHQLGVAASADADASSVEVLHVGDAAVTAAGDEDGRADDPDDGAGDVLRAPEVAGELDGDRGAGREGS